MNLLVINDYGLNGGGAENRIELLIEKFAQKDTFDEIHLIQQERKNLQDFEDVYVHECKPGFFSAYKTTKDVIKENNIDILQAHNMAGLSPAPILAARKLGVPIIWFAHDYWAFCGRRNLVSKSGTVCSMAKKGNCARCLGPSSTFVNITTKSIVNKADVGIAPSKFVKNIYEEHGLLEGSWQVIKPWINLDLFGTPGKRNAKTILFVGPLDDFKGAWVVAKALKIVKNEIPDVKLKFVGGGHNENKEKIENIGKTEGTLSNMEFLGEMKWEDLKKEYREAGVYVCPPTWPEVFGLTWAEAMASGCPVIASSVGSIPELLNDKGILTLPGVPNVLANDILKVLTDHDYANKLGNEGREYVHREFNVDRAADKIHDLYLEIL